jgi:hypothetical protein
MSDHTQTPWVVGWYDASLDFVKIGVHVAVCKPDLSLIATCGPAGDKASEADAAFIVRAVNSHEDLTYALNRVLHDADLTSQVREIVEKAIKKAEGK